MLVNLESEDTLGHAAIIQPTLNLVFFPLTIITGWKALVATNANDAILFDFHVFVSYKCMMSLFNIELLGMVLICRNYDMG